MELTLHIGAHRTATTAMQDMLVASEAALSERGIKALVHAQLGFNTGFPDVVHHKNWDQARTWIDAQTQSARKVIISDEGMIGDMGWNLRSGTFYLRAFTKLTAYRDFLGQAPARVGLGIREYGSYWQSAHGKELLYRNMQKLGVPRFDDIRLSLLAAKRGWLDLIADIRAVFKTSEIVVWPLDANIPIDHLGRYLLNEDDLMLIPPSAAVNAGPEVGILPALEAFRTAHPTASSTKTLAWLKTQKPTDYQGFTQDERARLGQLYQMDIDALKQGFADVTFLRFDMQETVVAKRRADVGDNPAVDDAIKVFK